jgi:GNAT superfamily N-acetyltransferase
VELHGLVYARLWGPVLGFEAQVARELADFCDAYDPARDLFLTAHVDDVLAGSVAISATLAKLPGAQLRWFVVDNGHRGRGIGRTLLARALTVCRERRLDPVYLWTVEGLPESFHLYQQFGFRVVERHHDARYGLPHTALRLELSQPHL